MNSSNHELRTVLTLLVANSYVMLDGYHVIIE